MCAACLLRPACSASATLPAARVSMTLARRGWAARGPARKSLCLRHCLRARAAAPDALPACVCANCWQRRTRARRAGAARSRRRRKWRAARATRNKRRAACHALPARAPFLLLTHVLPPLSALLQVVVNCRVAAQGARAVRLRTRLALVSIRGLQSCRAGFACATWWFLCSVGSGSAS